jgi:hypothetical protein|eukprot:SAG25_NODE_19_length_23408_cov_10.997040_26_plen_90_part_00
MIVRVQTPDGQLRLEVSDDNDLSALKQAVEEACAVRTWDQQFSRDISGRRGVPDDGRSLRALNVTCAASAHHSLGLIGVGVVCACASAD